MALRIYVVPGSAPGTRTLQASAAVWQRLYAIASTSDRKLAMRLRGVIAGIDNNAPAIQHTFPESVARDLLHMAGVSA